MNFFFVLPILWSICSLANPQDFPATSSLKIQKRNSLTDTLSKRTGPKTLPIKRSTETSFKSSVSRILNNNKTPFNVLQNGPYYINHYVYCDDIDHRTLEKIKSGTLYGEKDIQMFSIHHNKLHHFDKLDHGNNADPKPGSYYGDKEFHILHLPKDEHHNFEDLKLHLSLLNAHKSSKIPEIDLDLNKHLGSFEVSLENIKPLDLDTTFLDSTTKSSLHEVVTPLIQGQLSTNQNHKQNDNLIHIAEYLNEHAHSAVDHKSQNYEHHRDTYDSEKSGEILEVPHFEQHPLEHDPSKSSYNSPEAVDSYGNPATTSYTGTDQLKYGSESVGSYGNTIFASKPKHNIGRTHYGYHQSKQGLVDSYGNPVTEPLSPHHGIASFGFGHGLKSSDLYQSGEITNQLNEIKSFQRKRRMNENRMTSTEQLMSETQHPNHKYE